MIRIQFAISVRVEGINFYSLVAMSSLEALPIIIPQRTVKQEESHVEIP